MRASSLLAAWLCLGSSFASADTYPRQPAVDAIHYRFALALSQSSMHIDGEATATFRLTAPTAAIELDFISASGTTGMTVSSVRRAGAAVAFVHVKDRLRLPVPEGARPGEELTYTITYSGTPAGGLQAFTNIHGERVMFSEGWPDRARHWLPMIDHPYDKATGEMVVTAPAQWQVVSNGVLVEEVDLEGGRRQTHWRQSVPIASWLFAIGVARFDAHHAGAAQGVALQTWSFPQDRTAARTLFEETSRRALDFFSARVGPYPYEKLANVQASGYAGGMENATVIFYGEKGVASGRGPVVHEIAHQWFGNSVTERDWDDVWLSEGFATYFALLYREQFEGRDDFVEGLKRNRTVVLEAQKKTPDVPVVHRNLSDMNRVLNRFVYEKGGWVLHMLRDEIGTEPFWRGIAEYYRRYRDRNATTGDLRQVMEQVAGRDLGWFFAQWLTRGGNPSIEATWHYDRTQGSVEVTLHQTHAGEPYLMNLDVEIAAPSEKRIERVRIDRATTVVSFTVKGEPSAVTLDPDTWLLADLSDARREARSR